MTERNHYEDDKTSLEKTRKHYPSYDEHCLRSYLLSGDISPERKEEIQQELDWLTTLPDKNYENY